MAHDEQKTFCKLVKRLFPDHFYKKRVLDCGSLDINGSNQHLFEDCEYIGIDIIHGKNVDIVSTIHELQSDELFDTIISTECFEHDMFYPQSLRNIYRLLKPEGLFLFTCATTGRGIHGVKKRYPQDSPGTSSVPIWQDYYKNLTQRDIEDVYDMDNQFREYSFEIDTNHCDLMFWGIKK